MKHTLRLSTLAGAIVAAVVLTSLAPVSQREAKADPRFRAPNGGYYYGGGYARSYGSYSGYGYSQFGNGGYTYYAPRAYSYPSYRVYEFGEGFRHGASDYGLYGRRYGGSGFYRQSYRPANSPFGYGGYGGYGSYGF